MTAVAKFLSHLRETNPRFVCSHAGTESEERLELPIGHSLAAPAGPEHFRLLRRLLGKDATEVESLYGQHNGMELYRQSHENVGLILYSINQWEDATETFKVDLEDWGRSIEDIHEFENHGIAIGEPAFSGNHIFLHEGAVYYSNHDGGDDLLDRARGRRIYKPRPLQRRRPTQPLEGTKMRHRILVPLTSDPTIYRESDALAAGEGRFRLVGRVGTAAEPLLYKRGEIVECSILQLPDGSKGLVATRSVSADSEFRSRRTVYAVMGAIVGAAFGAALALCIDFSSTAVLVGAGIGAPIFALCSIRWGDAAWELLSEVVRWR